MFFGKQKFDVKQLKLNKFMFDIKQLKINKFTFDVKQLTMNRFIKSISDLIISTSNVTLEVPSLRPWNYGFHLIKSDKIVFTNNLLFYLSKSSFLIRIYHPGIFT